MFYSYYYHDGVVRQHSYFTQVCTFSKSSHGLFARNDNGDKNSTNQQVFYQGVKENYNTNKSPVSKKKEDEKIKFLQLQYRSRSSSVPVIGWSYPLYPSPCHRCDSRKLDESVVCHGCGLQLYHCLHPSCEPVRESRSRHRTCQSVSQSTTSQYLRIVPIFDCFPRT